MGILDVHILKSTENKKTFLIVVIDQDNDVSSSVGHHVRFCFHYFIFYIIK